MSSSVQSQILGPTPDSPIIKRLGWARAATLALMGGLLLWVGLLLRSGQVSAAEISSASAAAVITLAAALLLGALIEALVPLLRLLWLNVLVAVAGVLIGLLGFSALILLSLLFGTLGQLVAVIAGLLFIAAYLASLVAAVVVP